MRQEYTYEDSEFHLDDDIIYTDDFDTEDDEEYPGRPRTTKQRVEDYLEQRRLRELLDDY